MRICLAVHGFPPFERTGVENYTRSLAGALAARGHAVEVFAPRRDELLPHLALRREQRGPWAVTWVAANVPPRSPEEALDPPGMAARFGEFLDRERPELVHFQHLYKLGTSLVTQAEARGIPTVLTAHDYWSVCHRYTLLRPDLTRCETLGDPSACARCDLALARLNARPELGDYQMGALPEQLDEDDLRALRALVDGDAAGAGVSEGELAAAEERRTELDRARLAAVRRIDRVLAPTRFLADRLGEGGVPREKLRVLPYGIDTSALAAVKRESPVRRREGGLRIGYFGGISKHKGVHVLLEAFRGLGRGAELVVHGAGSDGAYTRLVRAAASEAGARVSGAYDAPDLPALLAETDVVVVPSLWVENYPIVIREAFAAGRPVVASRVGAVPESVRDGVDGLLFEPGDAADLRRVLRRLDSEEGLLERLAEGIGPVHDVAEQAAELEELYRSLGGVRAKPRGALPASLVRHVARYDELGELPLRDLFVRATAGIARLARELAGPEARADLYPAALAAGSRGQDAVRDRRREVEWVRSSLAGAEEEADSLRRELVWKEEQLRDRSAAVGHLEEVVASGREAEASLVKEREWLRGLLDQRTDEVAWLRGVLEERERELGALRATLEAAQRAHAGAQRDLGELRAALRDHRAALEGLRSDVHDAVKDLRSARATLPGTRGELSSRVRAEVSALLHVVERMLSGRGADESLVPLGRELAADLDLLEEEARWRRSEMEWLAAKAREGALRPLPLALRLARMAERIEGWSPPEDEA